MERKARVSTPILDRHGKIGPFFFKEAFLILVIFITSWCLFLILGSFIYIPPSIFFGTLASILLLVSLLRLFFIKRIDSPWYIHHWVASVFIQPKRFTPHAFPYTKERIVFLKRRANQQA
jgi:hypothetical protein